MSISDSVPATQGVILDEIPFSRLPWIRPLVSAHADRFDTVAPLFAGNPANPADWREVIRRVQHAAGSRESMATVLDAQLARRDAPDAARAAAQALASPLTVAVVTGQQAGLFGGPFYTLLKAITTIQLARKLAAEHGVSAVPVFWVDAEDHDFQEIRTAHVLDRESTPVDVALGDLPGAGTLPVAAVTLDGSVEQVITRLGEVLSQTEFTGDLLESLGRHYRAGVSVSAAFAGWIEQLLGPEGLVVFEAADPGAKRAAARVFSQELASPGGTARNARLGGAEMAKLGHHPQIEPGEDVVCLFYLDGAGRRPIRCRDGQFTVGDESWDQARLTAEASSHPERFSPNVLLRPIVQDVLFPTVCYVAGPSELAYQAQLGGAYQAFGVPQPLLASRVSATVLDSAASKFFDRSELPLEGLQPQDDSALNRLLEAQLPPELEHLFSALDHHLAEGTARLKPAAVAVDPTLAGAVDTTLDRLRDTVKNLQGKILQASKRKDDTLRRQFTRTRSLVFPGGQPQERVLNIAFFVNRYGPGLAARLIAALPALPDAHYVITP